MGWAFLTYVSGTLYPVPLVVMSFFLHGWGFIESRISSIFSLVSRIIVGFLLHELGFIDSRILDPFFLVSSIAIGFFLYGYGFTDSYVMGIFCLESLTMVGFFLHESNFTDSCISSTFCFVSFIVIGFFRCSIWILVTFVLSNMVFIYWSLLRLSLHINHFYAFWGSPLLINVSLDLIWRDTYLQYGRRQINPLPINPPRVRLVISFEPQRSYLWTFS